MKTIRWLLLLLMLLGVVACQGGNVAEPDAVDATQTPLPPAEPTPEPTPTPATELTMNLNEPFALPAGMSVAVSGTDLVLTFSRVVEDSRCPTQVSCFWTGRAVVDVEVKVGNAAAQTITFDTNPAPSELLDTITVNGYTIHLQSLDPYPEHPDNPIPFEAYTATLVVSETSEEPLTTEPVPAPTEAIVSPEARLNEPFILGGGQTIILSDADLQLTFTQVLEDSRCPKQVDCFWSGRIIIEVAVQQGAAAPQLINLQTSTAPSETADTVEVLGYTIFLATVDPYPDEPLVTIPFESYQATLTVSQ